MRAVAGCLHHEQAFRFWLCDPLTLPSRHAPYKLTATASVTRQAVSGV